MKVRRKLATDIARATVANHPEASNEMGAVDPSYIADALGVDVRHFELEDDLSGFLLTENGTALIGVNLMDSEKRQRYTIAHELGHYFLHDRTESYVDSRSGRAQILARDNVTSLGVDHREIEANVFAAELLMPEDRIRAAVEIHGSLGIFDDQETEIRQLADQFQVSVRAMTIRLERLGLLESF